MRLRSSLPLFALCAAATACPPPPTPELQTTPVGIVVGEVFVADPIPRSVSDADVALLGLSGGVITQAGQKFAFPAVPVGTHTMSIVHPPTGRAARFDLTVSQQFQTLELDPDLTTLGEPATLSGEVVVEGGGELAAADVFLVGGTSAQRDGVGDDGTFTLALLPPGDHTIGAHLPGYAPALRPVSLASGANTLGEPLALELTDVDDLSLGSKIHLVGREDASGALVYLNDGEDIVSVGADGAYAFTDLVPGVYSVRGAAPGYASARLDNIVLTPSGAVIGLKELSLAPGQDPPPSPSATPPPVVDAGPAIDAGPGASVPLEVTVVASSAQAVAGVDLTFLAEVDHPSLDTSAASFTWTRTRLDEAGTEAPLCDPACGGDVAVAALEVGTWRVGVEAAVGSARGDDFVIVEVEAPALDLDVLSPPPGLSIQVGEPFVLQAEVSATDGAPVDVTWQLGGCPAPDGEVLATGLNATVALSGFAPVVDLAAVADSATAQPVCVQRTLLMPAPIAPALYPTVSASELQIATPTLVPGDDVAPSSVTIKERHPAQLIASAPAGTDISWSSDTGIEVGGPILDLGQLPVATHLFTLQLGAAPAPVVQQTIEVVVEAAVFTASVTSPLVTQTYLRGDSVPLAVAIDHPWQGAFPDAQVRWSDGAATPVAYGGGAVVGGVTRPPALLSGLDEGTLPLSVTVTDALGVSRIVQTQAVVLDLLFGVSIQTPLDDAVYALGTDVPVAIDVSHTLLGTELMQSDFSTSVVSSRNGLLASDIPFGVPTPVGGLDAGSHTLTVIVSDGVRFASDEVAITVAAPPALAVTRLSPFGASTDLLPADDGSPGPLPPWSFQVDNATEGVTRYTWYLDGLLIDDAWFPGLPVDPLDPARASISPPDYDAAAAPWDDPRWAPGDHTVELCASNDAGALREVCAGFIARTFSSFTLFDAALEGPVTDGEGLALTGAVRLSGVLSIEGGTVTIAPGTRVLAEPGAGIILHHGALVIGQAGASPVEMVPSTGAPNGWTGITLQGDTGPASAAFRQTVLRYATQPIALLSAWATDDGAVASDLTIEGGTTAIGPGCLDVMERVTIRGASMGVIENNGYGCDGDRLYDTLTVEGATVGLRLDARVGGSVVVTNSVFRDHLDGVAFAQGTVDTLVDVLIEDSRFEGGRTGGFDVITRSAGGGTLALFDNTFIDGSTAFRFQGSYQGADSLDIFLRGNRIEGMSEGISWGATRRGAVVGRGNAFVDVLAPVAGSDANGSITDTMRIDLRGNYFGDPASPGTPAFGFVNGPVGARFNVPGVDDHFDGEARWTIDIDGMLLTPFGAGAPPLAFLAHPRRSDVYHRGSCVAFDPIALHDGFDVTAGCTVTLMGPGAPTPIALDAEGCADAPSVFADGVNTARLDCTDGAQSSSHEVAFRVSDDSISGSVRRAVQVIDEDVTLVGDLFIPANTRLEVVAGVTLGVAGADALVDVHENPADIGSRAKVDLRVEGELALLGASGAPARLAPDDGVASFGKWGDVILEHSTASFEASWAEIEGASAAALVVDNGEGDVPSLTFSDVVFTDNEVVATGCPQAFNDVTVNGARHVFGYKAGTPRVACDTSVTVLRADIDEVSAMMFNLASRGDGPTYTLSIIDADVRRTHDRADAIVGAGDVAVVFEGATIRNGSVLVARGWHGSLTIRDSHVENFNVVHDFNTSNTATALLFERSVFVDLNRISEQRYSALTFVDNYVETTGAALIFWKQPGINALITGNEVAAASPFVYIDHNGTLNAGVVPTISNNNFPPPPGVAIEVDSSVEGPVDATGNYWGVVTDAEVEARIVDPNNDAAPDDGILGWTSYAPYATAPLSLPDAPPAP